MAKARFLLGVTARVRGVRAALLATAFGLCASSGGAQPAPWNAANAAPWGAQPQGSELDRWLSHLDAEEKSLTDELQAGTTELGQVRARILVRGKAYYKLVRAGLLPAGSGFEKLVDHAARVERSRRALERDLALEKQLTQRGIAIGERLTRLRAEREPLVVQREAMTRASAALAQAEERRAAFARAFDASERVEHVAIYGADLGPSDVDPKAGFRAYKGRLPMPVSGRVEVRRAARQGAAAAGLEFATTFGTPVRAVAGGRVAFADVYENEGLTILIDHGDHYYTLYAGLGQAEVHVGDIVPSGGRIGTVGNRPTGGTALYFEVRKRADQVDAGAWLGL